MEICFLKSSALDTLKSSLPKTFAEYFRQRDNSWLGEVCGENPFVKFRDLPDFELTALDSGMDVGEIELRNCKILYRQFSFLTPRQAADERFWAGLCHSVFYDYVRRRWKLGNDKIPPQAEAVKNIRSRFFFGKSRFRENIFTNTLSKCWWTGRAFFDSTRKNSFEKLDTIGANNFYTKIFSLMTRSFAANPKILSGIIKFIKHLNDSGIKFTTERHLRPALSELNRHGGAVILDCLTEDDIAAIMIENVEKNSSREKIFGLPNDDEPRNLIEHVEKNSSREKIFGSTRTVKAGDKVTVIPLDNGKPRNYKVNGKLKTSFPDIFAELVGKAIHTSVTLRDEKFTITEIT